MLPITTDLDTLAIEDLLALFVAKVVRDNLEEFHVKHLSDAQMRELNPLIRNAVYTALHVAFGMHKSTTLQAYFDHVAQTVPIYWEKPQLTDDFLIYCALVGDER